MIIVRNFLDPPQVTESDATILSVFLLVKSMFVLEDTGYRGQCFVLFFFLSVFMQQVDPQGNVYTPLIYGDSHPLDDFHYLFLFVLFFYVHPWESDKSKRESERREREIR